MSRSRGGCRERLSNEGLTSSLVMSVWCWANWCKLFCRTIQDPSSQILKWRASPKTVLIIKKIRDDAVDEPFVQLALWLVQVSWLSLLSLSLLQFSQWSCGIEHRIHIMNSPFICFTANNLLFAGQLSLLASTAVWKMSSSLLGMWAVGCTD